MLIAMRTFLHQTFSNMWRYKLRSFLTMFGIAWGVVSLVLLSGLCDGFRDGQKKNMAQIGKDIVMVWGGKTEIPAPGQPAGRWIRLTRADIERIREEVPSVNTVSGEVKNHDLPASSDFNSGKFLTLGVNPDYLALRNFPLGSGRHINQEDVAQTRRVAVLGSSVQEQLFPNQRNPLGARISIRGFPYTVVGTLSKKSQNSSYDGWDNDKLLIPDSVFLQDVPASLDSTTIGVVQSILYRPASVNEWESAQKQVTAVLANSHNFDRLDENAVRMWDTVESAKKFGQIFNATEVFLSIIALITLALGGVSVMNTMMMAVAERTNEIGLKKALGASRYRILGEFFLEGLLLALISGAGGSLVVLSLTGLISALPLPEFFTGIPIDHRTLLLVSSSLMMVAVLSALPPAWRAAAMTPVEALRFER
ncbi:MAG: ABC transporter permease [Bryobacterales bacterium]|nr:ABC transporter permease [Bryobacterales bacterium]